MISPLSIATEGYLNKTKRVLSISVSGYLAYSDITPPIPPTPPRVPTTGGGGSGGSIGIKLGIDSLPRKFNKKIYYTNSEQNKFELEDEELKIIIKAFLECQK
jgi:hypothetical protein